MTADQVLFMSDKTKRGNGIANGENKKRIAVAVTALQGTESSRDMWKSLFFCHYNEDAEECCFDGR